MLSLFGFYICKGENHMKIGFNEGCNRFCYIISYWDSWICISDILPRSDNWLRRWISEWW